MVVVAVATSIISVIITASVIVCCRSRQKAVADPGFGEGGAQKYFPRFCGRSEVKSGEQIELYNIGGGPGPALGPWKLQHF